METVFQCTVYVYMGVLTVISSPKRVETPLEDSRAGLWFSPLGVATAWCPIDHGTSDRKQEACVGEGEVCGTGLRGRLQPPGK